MYRFCHYFLLFIGLFGASICYGQAVVDTLISEVQPADFQPSSTVIDSNANVVVLRDSGSVDLLGKFYGWRVKQMRYRRLLIRNKNGFDVAKVEISFDPEVNVYGKLFTLHGYTCNLVNGKIVRTPIDTGEIFTEETSGGRMKERFTFPDVREGSIIEYTYTIYFDCNSV